MNELPVCLMTEAEISRLEELASGHRVLELGAWKGAGTARLARMAQEVWSVDHHQGDAHTGPRDTLGEYLHSLEAAGVRSRVVSVVGTFKQVLPGLRHGRWGLVVVDGAHDPQSVRHDCLMADELCSWWGCVAVHDWGRFDVAPVARSVLGEPMEVVESLAVFRSTTST